MTEIAIAETAAKTIWGIVKPFLIFIVCAVIGIAAAELWEHSGPRPSINVWFIHWSPFGQSLKAQRDQALAQIPVLKKDLSEMTANRDAWKKSDEDAEGTRTKANQDAADAISKASSTHDQSADVAFNSGYAAGNAVGRKTCGAPNAIPSIVPGGQPAADGVRVDPADDLSGFLAAGAYKPGTEVRP